MIRQVLALQFICGQCHLYRIPTVCEVVVNTFITTFPPALHAQDFVNHKSFFLVMMHGIINHLRHFTLVNSRCLVKVHGAKIFRNFGLPKLIEFGSLSDGVSTIKLKGITMLTVLIGHTYYPVQLCLMKLFTGHLDTCKELFNYCFSSCCMAVECAFGHASESGSCHFPLKALYLCISLYLNKKNCLLLHKKSRLHCPCLPYSSNENNTFT